MRRIAVGTALAGALLAACIPDAPPEPPAPKVAATDAGTPADLGTADSKSLLSMVEAIKGQLKDRPRDFSINVALGNLYYDNGRFIEAVQYFTEAFELIAASEKHVAGLVATKALPTKTPVPEACKFDRPGDEEHAKGLRQRTLESIASTGTQLEAGDPKGALACWGQLVLPLANIHAKRGNAWYLVGNSDKARQDHTAALALDPNNAEALFFSGAITLELSRGEPAKLAEGKRFWEKLLKVAPDSSRASMVKETLPKVDELFGPHAQDPMAGHPPVAGESRQMPQGPGPLPAGVAEAAANVPRTAETEAALDKMTADAEALLGKGEWQQALDAFKGVMPLKPSGRLALGMGIALRELGKPTAERVLMQATQMPGGDPPRAKLELAIFYEKKDPAQARQLLTSLVDDPSVGAAAKTRLGNLK